MYIHYTASIILANSFLLTGVHLYQVFLNGILK